MLTQERFDAYLTDIRSRLADKTQDEMEKLDESLNIDFEEHFQFQKQQSLFHAERILSTDVAQTIYVMLGETPNQHNGGWADRVDTSMKFVITKLMAELLEVRIRRAS